MEKQNEQLKTLEVLYKELDLYTKETRNKYPDIICKAGCSQCCRSNGSPPVTAVEWLYLEPVLKEQNLQEIYLNTQESLDQITLDLGMKKNITPKIQCSLLSKEGTCTIYTHRPLICRLFGYTSRSVPLIKRNETEDYIYTCMMEILRWKEEKNEVIYLKSKDYFLDILNKINEDSDFKTPGLLLSWISNYLAINGYNLKNASNINFIQLRL